MSTAERNMLAQRCAWEIQAWAAVIAQRVDQGDTDAPDLWLRGAAVRLDSLACAVMTACSDEPLAHGESHFFGPPNLRTGCQE